MSETGVIAPSIGRVVWYWPSQVDNENGYIFSGGQPFAALVAYVHTDRLVNLSVFDMHGRHFAKQEVVLVQPVDKPQVKLAGGYCEWMPYQIAQAKV